MVSVCCALISSTSGNSDAGRLDSVKRLRPARTDTRSPSVLSMMLTFSGNERKMSRSLRPGTVISPGCCTLTAQVATSSTSRSVPVTLSLLSRAASSTFASTGIVCRRSTTPMTLWRGASSSSRAAVSFMGRSLSRSEEHTSELQSRLHLVCRLLLEKKTEEDHKDRQSARPSPESHRDQTLSAHPSLCKTVPLVNLDGRYILLAVRGSDGELSPHTHL